MIDCVALGSSVAPFGFDSTLQLLLFLHHLIVVSAITVATPTVAVGYQQ